jgi:tetratricopeptide (TPR) repeat protein
MIKHRARAAYERGQEWRARGDLTKAIGAYQEAIAIEPDWVVPYQQLGSLFLESGRYDEAIAAYRQATMISLPGDGSIDDMLDVVERIQSGALDPGAYHYYTLARDLPDEELEQKMALCQQALALSPAFPAPYAILGKVLLAQGQPNQARTVIEHGLACEPTPFTRARLLFNLGNVLLVLGQRENALAAFRQVIQVDADLSATRFATIQLEAAAAGRI